MATQPRGYLRLNNNNMSFLASLANNEGASKPLRDKALKLIEEQGQVVLEQEQAALDQSKEAAEKRALVHAGLELKESTLQKECGHRKVWPGGQLITFLAGQRMQDGTLFLLCQNCRKVYSRPARPDLGWEHCPDHLVPAPGMGAIGSIVDVASAIRLADPGLIDRLAREANVSVEDLRKQITALQARPRGRKSARP